MESGISHKKTVKNLNFYHRAQRYQRNDAESSYLIALRVSAVIETGSGLSGLPHRSRGQCLVEVRSSESNVCIEVIRQDELNAAFVGSRIILILDPPSCVFRQESGIRYEERESVPGIMQLSIQRVAGGGKRPRTLSSTCLICGECDIEDFFPGHRGEEVNAGFDISKSPPVGS